MLVNSWSSVTLGDYPLMPNWAEKIHRNLSSLRYVILTLRDENSPVKRRLLEEEARALIRMHNIMVEQHLLTLRRSR